jgi:hypothetical protein
MNDLDLLFAVLGAYLVVILLIGAFLAICQWKIFTKAGKPGWAILIPFYNLYVYTQIIKRPSWWMVLYFLSIIPFIGSIAVLVIAILDTVRLAKVFGKDTGFAIGLVLLPIVFIPMLAFGSAEYHNENATSGELLD